MKASAFILLAWLAATLLHCQKAPAVANTSVSCEAQEKQRDFFFPRLNEQIPPLPQPPLLTG